MNRPALVFLKVSFVVSGTGKGESQEGTGFVISPSGYVLTARHVVIWKAATDDTVILGSLGSREEFPLRLTVVATNSDFALLKFDNTSRTYTAVTLGDPAAVTNSTELCGMGFPAGKEFVHAPGIVSGEEGAYWLTNMPSNEGDSGALVSVESGAVVAMKTAGYETLQNINRLVPINLAQDLISKVPDTSRTDHFSSSNLRMVIDETFWNMDKNTYFEDGNPTAGFLRQLLRQDLKLAFARAYGVRLDFGATAHALLDMSLQQIYDNRRDSLNDSIPDDQKQLLRKANTDGFTYILYPRTSISDEGQIKSVSGRLFRVKDVVEKPANSSIAWATLAAPNCGKTNDQCLIQLVNNFLPQLEQSEGLSRTRIVIRWQPISAASEKKGGALPSDGGGMAELIKSEIEAAEFMDGLCNDVFALKDDFNLTECVQDQPGTVKRRVVESSSARIFDLHGTLRLFESQAELSFELNENATGIVHRATGIFISYGDVQKNLSSLRDPVINSLDSHFVRILYSPR